MRSHAYCLVLAAILASAPIGASQADDDADYVKTLDLFRQSAASGAFFDHSYGYAVFPNVGKVAFAIGGANGRGRVYVKGRHVGDARLSQVSLGFSVGVQAFREIIFFEDERAFWDFASGGFEFGADASLVFVRIGAAASAGTQGVSAGAGADSSLATVGGGYYKGMAAFVVPRFGGMLETGISGQRFSYMPVEEAGAAPAGGAPSAPAPESATELLLPVEALELPPPP